MWEQGSETRRLTDCCQAANPICLLSRHYNQPQGAGKLVGESEGRTKHPVLQIEFVFVWSFNHFTICFKAFELGPLPKCTLGEIKLTQRFTKWLVNDFVCSMQCLIKAAVKGFSLRTWLINLINPETSVSTSDYSPAVDYKFYRMVHVGWILQWWVKLSMF